MPSVRLRPTRRLRKRRAVTIIDLFLDPATKGSTKRPCNRDMTKKFNVLHIPTTNLPLVDAHGWTGSSRNRCNGLSGLRRRRGNAGLREVLLVVAPGWHNQM